VIVDCGIGELLLGDRSFEDWVGSPGGIWMAVFVVFLK
jgi:hypothetical protein